MNKLFFLIGSSGSGKTTTARLLEEMRMPNFVILHSDSIHVPSSEEMVKEYGSTDEWQRNSTVRWVQKIKEEYIDSNNVIFDIQSRPSFIKEACGKADVESYKIVLFDCSDKERKRRLIEERQSPELANDKMMDWARYLREACVEDNCQIIDNTDLSPSQTTEKFLEIIK